MKERLLNLDSIISEQNAIMQANFNTKEKDPEAYRWFVTARMLKVYLLKKYAEQENECFHGHWIKKDGEEICSVCWMPRQASELNGECIMCGAKMKGDE